MAIKISAAAKKFLSQGREGNVTFMLRCCDENMKGYGDFQWPAKGPVEAPDWDNRNTCGYGLHGWLMGKGDVLVSNYWENPEAKWLVCAVWSSDVVDLGGKVKVPRAWVLFTGTREEAANEMVALGAKACMFAVLTGEYNSTLTGGYNSTLTGGHNSTLTGGYNSTLTGGYNSTLTGGDRSTITGGNHSTLTGGNYSTLTGGDGSTLTGGYDSTLTGGDYSTLNGGSGSTLTGGSGSTLTGGDYSTITGGSGSTLLIKFWDGSRYRIKIAYVDENGIAANVAYKLDESGNFVKVEK